MVTLSARVLGLGVMLWMTSVSGFSSQVTPQSGRDLVLSGRRVALVIGNNTYAAAPLRNAVADARSIGSALRDLGFAVTMVENADRSAMAKAVSGLAASLTSGDVVFFYYAGHGVQVNGENYLIPTDFDARDVATARLAALAASDIQELLAKAKVALLVLDACRNNPFSGQRGASGLAAMEARGSLVAYSTGAGQTASDNPGGENGLFAQELLKTLKESTVSARELFYRVRQRVFDASGGQQFPAVYDGLLGDYAFRAGAPSAAPSKAPDGTEAALWEAIDRSGRLSDYELYLHNYPAGVYAPLAANRIDAIKNQPSQVPAVVELATPTPPAATINAVASSATSFPMFHFVIGGGFHFGRLSIAPNSIRWQEADDLSEVGVLQTAGPYDMRHIAEKRSDDDFEVTCADVLEVAKNKAVVGYRVRTRSRNYNLAAAKADYKGKLLPGDRAEVPGLTRAFSLACPSTP